MDLKYGCNPHQQAARLIQPDGASPLRVLNGQVSYINILDALAGWQLVRELRQATGLPGAASFKHVNPAGAAVAGPISDGFRRSQMLPAEVLSPVALAYVRARGGDRMSSYGDAVAVSETVDDSLARMLEREVSDLIIAPAFEPSALKLLKTKQNGGYRILQIDPAYEPPAVESRTVFGLTLEQQRNDARIDERTFANIVTGGPLPADIVRTLMVATIALKYTQSNSMCVAYQGQVIGMGAGQQSRVHCTRLACGKADKWCLQQHPQALGLPFKPGLKRPAMTNMVDQYLCWDELSSAERTRLLMELSGTSTPLTAKQRAEWIGQFEGICLASDGYIPFRDNIDRASRSHVQYVAQPGDSLRDEEVLEAAQAYGMTMVHTGLRLFTH